MNTFHPNDLPIGRNDMKMYKMQPTTWFLIGFFAISTLLLSACSLPIIMGTEDFVTQEMEFADFDEIVISDTFNVEIHQGDEFRVTIEIDETLLEYLEVSQSEQQLKIGLRPHAGISTNFEPVRHAEITMPSLVGVHLDNASSLRGEFDTEDIWFIVDNASDLTLTGQGQNLILQVEEASSVNLADFAVHDATVTVTNASSAIVDVMGRLDAEANNASSIAYYGNPTLGNTRITLASSITPRDR